MRAEAVETSLTSRIVKLPSKIREQIEACPVAGQGVHRWLFKTALLLQKHFPEEEISEILSEYLSCTRPEREIGEAVANSGRIIRGEVPSSGPTKAWPGVDFTTIHNIVLGSRVRLKQLQANSPVHLATDRPKTEEILDTLYPGNPLLCFGRSANCFNTKPREFWRGTESSFQFIVPNTMTKEAGITKDGKDSKRCLDNTGPRRFLVIEFDISEDDEKWGPYVREWKAKGISVLDANVALILELAGRGLPRLPLALAVHSGGRSIHAWHWCEGLTEEQLRPFMVRGCTAWGGLRYLDKMPVS